MNIEELRKALGVPLGISDNTMYIKSNYLPGRIVALRGEGGQFLLPNQHTLKHLYDQCSRARGLVSKLQRCPTFSGKGRSIHEHLSAITARQNRIRPLLEEVKHD